MIHHQYLASSHYHFAFKVITLRGLVISTSANTRYVFVGFIKVNIGSKLSSLSAKFAAYSNESIDLS